MSVKVLLIMMVKNESKIIRRAITSALPIIDGLCVLDTGSTDDTIKIANNIIATLEKDKPGFIGKVFSYPFTNFGDSRSKSFEVAVSLLKEHGWDSEATHGLLLDADMVLKMDNPDKIKNHLEKADSAMIYQIQGQYKYFNTRFIRMSRSWECIGVTHEFWKSDNAPNTTLFENNIWIDDISDGGCKADKLERDAKMLLDGIKAEPTNYRYYFYLGQTYLCLQNPTKSLEYYKKYIEYDPSSEMRWFALCMLSKQNILLDNINEAKKYCKMAFEERPNRSEPLYEMAAYYTSINNIEKAEHYIKLGVDIPLPDRDIIYVDGMIYGYGFKLLEMESMLRKREKVPEKKFVEKFNKIRTSSVHGKQLFVDDLLWKFAVKIQATHTIGLPFQINKACIAHENKNNYTVLLDDSVVATCSIENKTLESQSQRTVPIKIESLFSHDGDVWVKHGNEICRLNSPNFFTPEQLSIKFTSDLVLPPIVAAFQRLLPVLKMPDGNVLGILQTMFPKSNKSLFMFVLRTTDNQVKNSTPFYFENINTEETCEAMCAFEGDKVLVVYTSDGKQKAIIVEPVF